MKKDGLPLDEKVRLGVAAAADRKAHDLVVLDIGKVSSFADYFILCHGTSDRQVRAIADGIDEVLRASGVRPLSIEGEVKGQWVLLDYGDLIFHIFLEDRRRFYALERLWGDAPDVTTRFAPPAGETRGRAS